MAVGIWAWLGRAAKGMQCVGVLTVLTAERLARATCDQQRDEHARARMTHSQRRWCWRRLFRMHVVPL